MENLVALAVLFCVYFLGVILAQRTLSLLSWIYMKSKSPLEFIKSWGDILFAVPALIFLGYLTYTWWPLSNDNSQVLIFSVTASTLFFQAIINSKSYQYRNRPKIRLDFIDSDSAYFHQTSKWTQTEILLQQGSSTSKQLLADYIPTYYVSLKIINVGNSTLDNTEAIIEKIVPKGETKLLRPTIPLNLYWSFAEANEGRKINIPPNGAYRILNFIELTNPEKSRAYFRNLKVENVDYKRYAALTSGFRTCTIPPNTLSDIFEQGSYIFTVGIYADNSKPIFKELSVEYNGKWDDEPKFMRKNHLKVRLLN